MTLRRLVEVPTQDWPPEGRATVVDASGADVALFNLGGRYFALSDFCIRCGASLARGQVAEAHVNCTCCGWSYEIATGQLPALPGLGVDSFEVEVLPSRLLITVGSG
jgi:3-phenylpropionate/trans-cinnamate dioxygenase ferredoxin subunit